MFEHLHYAFSRLKNEEQMQLVEETTLFLIYIKPGLLDYLHIINKDYQLFKSLWKTVEIKSYVK